MRNNSIIFTGEVIKIGNKPFFRSLYNKYIASSAYKKIGYKINVIVHIKNIFKGKSKISNQIKNNIITVKTKYNPPCKSLILPKIGNNYVFFPEDYGNCSKFCFPIINQKIQINNNNNLPIKNFDSYVKKYSLPKKM